MVQKREAGLLLSPKNKRKKVPIVVYGQAWGSACRIQLHELKDTPAGGISVGDKGVRSLLSQMSSAVTVSTIESDLNQNIEEANARRKEDA